MQRLNSRIGTFLKWDPAVSPEAPTGYVGDPDVDHNSYSEGLTIKTSSESRVRELEMVYPYSQMLTPNSI